MVSRLSRRQFSRQVCQGAVLGACGLIVPRRVRGEPSPENEPEPAPRRLYKSLKWGMLDVPGSTLDRFQAAGKAGFAGVELDSPGGPSVDEVRSAIERTGVVVDGAVVSTHWNVRLTDPDPQVRAEGLANLIEALKATQAWGGHSLLLVPGHGKDGTREEVYSRSAAQIRQALPVAAKVGIPILIENVWNDMFYDPQGGDDQTADELVRYVDQFQSPWVGVQFDIGNHQKFGPPAAWIRTLGRRIVKLDVKDWGRDAGFCQLGEGDVDWEAVRDALQSIGYTGWAAAEVQGGGPDRLADIAQRMDRLLGI